MFFIFQVLLNVNFSHCMSLLYALFLFFLYFVTNIELKKLSAATCASCVLKVGSLLLTHELFCYTTVPLCKIFVLPDS